MSRQILVDDCDRHLLDQFRWTVDGNYVCRFSRSEGKQTKVYLHREIMQPAAGHSIDHINGNGLDNRRANLRVCSHQQNMWNKKSCNGVSRYFGVAMTKNRTRWRAYITLHNKQKHLGTFDKEEDAALAFNTAAIEYRGEFAQLNKV